MPQPLIRYQLDITGLNRDNSVKGEIQNLTNRAIRAVAPSYGAFFAETLVVYDGTTLLPLRRGSQYICAELAQTPTEKYGKEIYYLILILDTSVSSSVIIDYQVLGGLYNRVGDAIANMYETVLADNRRVDFSSIIDKPAGFTPSMHMHDIRDVYGFEYVVDALERVRNAIIISDVPAFESTMDWIEKEIATLRGVFSTNLDVFSEHITKRGNPHYVNKSDVSLGLVNNLDIATNVDISHLVGLPNNADSRTIPVNKYVTLVDLLAFKNIVFSKLDALEAKVG